MNRSDGIRPFRPIVGGVRVNIDPCAQGLAVVLRFPGAEQEGDDADPDENTKSQNDENPTPSRAAEKEKKVVWVGAGYKQGTPNGVTSPKCIFLFQSRIEIEIQKPLILLRPRRYLIIKNSAGQK